MEQLNNKYLHCIITNYNVVIVAYSIELTCTVVSYLNLSSTELQLKCHSYEL